MSADERAREPLPPVDIDVARDAMRRLVNIAFKKLDANGEPYRPKFRIPYNENDDDAVLRRALDELVALRKVAEAARELVAEESGSVGCLACGNDLKDCACANLRPLRDALHEASLRVGTKGDAKRC